MCRSKVYGVSTEDFDRSHSIAGIFPGDDFTSAVKKLQDQGYENVPGIGEDHGADYTIKNVTGHDGDGTYSTKNPAVKKFEGCYDYNSYDGTIELEGLYFDFQKGDIKITLLVPAKTFNYNGYGLVGGYKNFSNTVFYIYAGSASTEERIEKFEEEQRSLEYQKYIQEYLEEHPEAVS